VEWSLMVLVLDDGYDKSRMKESDVKPPETSWERHLG